MRNVIWLLLCIGIALKFCQSQENSNTGLQLDKVVETGNNLPESSPIYTEELIHCKAILQQGNTEVEAIVKVLVATEEKALNAKNMRVNQPKSTYHKMLLNIVTILSQGVGVLGSKAELDAAIQALRQANIGLATNIFLKATQRSHASNKEIATAYRHLGALTALAYLEKDQEAMAYYRRATELEPDDAEGWNQLGFLLQRNGKFDESFATHEKVLALKQDLTDQQQISLAYDGIAVDYASHGELDKAIEFHQKGIKINEVLGNQERLADAYNHLGDIYYVRGDFDKAADFYQKTLQLDEALCDRVEIADDYANLGLVYNARGDFAKAVDFYRRAIQLNEMLDRQDNNTANGYRNFAKTYQDKGYTDKAIELHHKSLLLYDKLGNKEGMAINYGDLAGLYYQNLGTFDKAMEMQKKSLQLHEDLGNKKGILQDYSAIGYLHFYLRETDEAITVLQQALSIAQALDSPTDVANIYSNLGDAYTPQGNKVEARNYYQKALVLFTKLGSRDAEELVKEAFNKLN